MGKRYWLMPYIYLNNMDYLLLLQFACFLFMFFCALVLCITRLHMKWIN